MLNYTRFTVFFYTFCLLCQLTACSDKSQPSPTSQLPPQVKPENSVSEDIVDQENHVPEDITQEELGQYREELKDNSPSELIERARSDVSFIETSSKTIAKHLADNDISAAKRINADISKVIEKNQILLNVITLRILAAEFSPKEVETMKEISSEMLKALELMETVNNVALEIIEENDND